MYRVEIFTPSDKLNGLLDFVKPCGDSMLRDYVQCLTWFQVQTKEYTKEEDIFKEEYCIVLRCNKEGARNILQEIKKNHPDGDVTIDVMELQANKLLA